MTLDTPDRYVASIRALARPVEEVLREIRVAVRPRVAAWQRQASEARAVDEGVPLVSEANIPKHDGVVVEAILIRETDDAYFYRCLLRDRGRWVTMSVPK